MRVEPAYGYATKLVHHITVGGKSRKQVFPRRDQFAPELIYFSTCIQEHRNPEPSGLVGLADVRIIEALERSASGGMPVKLDRVSQMPYPGIRQEIHRPPVQEPELVHAESPSV